MEADKALVWASCTSPGENTSFLAWVRMRLDDKAVRVGVALQLGLQLCETYLCHCGSTVDANGSYAFVFKKASGRFERHSAINHIISRAVA